MSSSPLPPDPYVILGVSKDAQIPEIRSAHRKLVLKCHPDKVQDPTLKAIKQDEFQKVQQAYEILSDEKERQKYDDQVRLTELRKQAYAKANSSATRSSRPVPAEFEVHQTSARSSSRQTPPTTEQPRVKVYFSTSSRSRSWEGDEFRQSSRSYEPEVRTSPRRETSYYERERDSRPSKRESEREREREKDRSDRDRDREKRKRERARQDEKERLRQEEKEARKAEKKAREKQEAKELKRATEEKTRRAYQTPPEDEPSPRLSRKTTSSKKYESATASPLEAERSRGSDDPRWQAAAAYINKARNPTGFGAPQRSKTYHVPSPPISSTPTGYASPDEEEIHRSSATRTRRGSADMPRATREKSYTSKSSRERLDEEPLGRDPAPRPGFPKAASAGPGASGSPPRNFPSRTHTMPPETTFVRPSPGITRAQTFTDGVAQGGRQRSRLYAQAKIDESDDEDVYYDRDRVYESRQPRERDDREPRDRDARKHRSSKKSQPSERVYPSTTTYSVTRDETDGTSRTKQRTYQRHELPDDYDSYPPTSRYAAERPGLRAREPSYGSAYSATGKTFGKVRTAPSYGVNDAQYSSYTPAYA